MISLIRKDILFNIKWFIIFFAIAVLMPIIYFLDNETRFTLFVFILGPILGNSFFLPKTCYLDDNPQTKAFLFSLPITKWNLVGSKYVLGLICMFISILLTSVSALVLGLGFNIQAVAIAAIYLFIFYSVFLYSFYKSNYSNAEKSNMALMMLTVASAFLIDRSGLMLDTLVINPKVVSLLLVSCLVLYALSYIGSVQGYRK